MVIKSQSFHASVKSNMFQVFQNEANKTTEPRRFSGKIKKLQFSKKWLFRLLVWTNFLRCATSLLIFLLHDSSSITKNLEKSEKFKIFSRLGLRKFSRKSDKKEWRGDKYSEPSGQSVFNGVLWRKKQLLHSIP